MVTVNILLNAYHIIMYYIFFIVNFSTLIRLFGVLRLSISVQSAYHLMILHLIHPLCRSGSSVVDFGCVIVDSGVAW